MFDYKKINEYLIQMANNQILSMNSFVKNEAPFKTKHLLYLKIRKNLEIPITTRMR